jgi:transglutaminase-like putative cysteine protease
MSNTNNNTENTRLKPAPLGLTLASLLVWGWQTELLLYAIVMGILLELPYFVKWRIDFSDKDINQLADLSGIVFFIAIVYIFINYEFQGIYKILELVPFALIIIMLAQNYGVQNSIKTSALFISVRRLGEKADTNILYRINISLPYVFLCLISASSGHKHDYVFFIISSLIIAWTLSSLRSKHYSLIHWFTPIIAVVALSFLMQQGLKDLQKEAEAFFFQLFEQYGFKSTDPEKTSTAIGSLGRLKLSDRIVFRIETDEQFSETVNFHETSYSRYEFGSWKNPKGEFDIIEKTPNKKEWRLNSELKDKETFDVSIYLQDDGSVIPVPDNINSLSGKGLIQVETNIHGSTRIEASKGWVSYRIGASNKVLMDNKPVADDLEIPQAYANDFKQLAEQLELYSKTPNEVIATIKKYFRENFYYSITQNQRYTRGQYLTKFLFKDKKGHCEYFATATALLLREAGIPARYAIGYSVMEYNTWQEMYLVRARHAHAWTKYYLNGKWHNIDTTPSIWAPMEAADKTFLEPIIDFFSWLRYKLTGSGIDDDIETTSTDWMLWLLLPLMAYLGWRFYKKQRVDKIKEEGTTSYYQYDRHGLDSPIYTLVAELEKKADKRLSGETLNKWIKRILPKEKSEKYQELIKQHGRYRFKPDSNKKNEKQRLIETINHLS